MSQADLGALNPVTTSGNALASLLTAWRTALHSLHSGATRPSYAVAGMLWLKDVSASQKEMTFYTGAADLTLDRINPTDSTITRFGTAFQIDANARWSLTGTNIDIQFDANDFYRFERAANRHSLVINGITRLTADATAVEAFDPAGVRVVGIDGDGVSIHGLGTRVRETALDLGATDLDARWRLRTDNATKELRIAKFNGVSTWLDLIRIKPNGDVDLTQFGGSLVTQLAAKLDKAGGTMTGALTLAGAPAAANQAATKAYVDGIQHGHTVAKVVVNMGLINNRTLDFALSYSFLANVYTLVYTVYYGDGYVPSAMGGGMGME